jgi:Cd2+/Zn2+-exporting ATPase
MAIEKTYMIEGVDCAVCAARIEQAINKVDGVRSSQIDLLQNRLHIYTGDEEDSSFSFDDTIRNIVSKEEPGTKVSSILDEPKEISTEGSPLSRFLRAYAIPLRIVFAAVLVICSLPVGDSSLAFFLTAIAYGISGYEIVYKAIRNLFRGNMFDENFLMTLATIGAFAIGEYTEAVAVMAFYQVGEFFQDLAVDRSRKSIAKLMDIKPQSATIIRDGKQITVKPEDITVGDALLIRPGEKIPVDAEVTSGYSSLDTSALTGESLPREVHEGDALISGSVNGSGVLHAKATNRYVDSTVASILKLVEESSQKKAKTERFITKFAKYYTPIVVVLAVFIASIPPLVGSGSFSTWLYRALVFLVVSCPCALVISVPLGFFGGIGGLARMGILVKGGNHIQTLAKTGHVVFDKTGTITKGTFSVDSIIVFDSSPYTEEQIIGFAGAVEANSHHPIAKAISTYALAKDIHQTGVEVQEIPGKGMRGIVDGITVTVGTDSYMDEIGLSSDSGKETFGGPSVLVSIGEALAGRIILSDTVKRESSQTIRHLTNLGIQRISMLSGDTKTAVSAVARSVGINDFYAELLPHEKILHMERMMKQKKSHESLLFVGDGINDAPVLARADIGASMGSMGSDAAVEASDMVIMTDDLSKIPQGIVHARKTVSIVTQNIIFALSIKVLVMALGTVGIATMWLAVFADTGVALLAVMNSLRALKYD